jgi:hypothetical protein
VGELEAHAQPAFARRIHEYASPVGVGQPHGRSNGRRALFETSDPSRSSKRFRY